MLLVAAMMFADIGGHAAGIVRRHYNDLTRPGALMDRSREWLRGRADWNGQDRMFRFPSGYKLFFAALDKEKDLEKVQGAEVQAWFVDEAGQLALRQREFLRTRLRKPEGSVIPIRFWEASNPDGVGEADLYHEYVEPFEKGAQADDHMYIPATLETNPYVSQEYRGRLMKRDPITRAKYLGGQWMVRSTGKTFPVDKLHAIRPALGQAAPTEFDVLLRAWDLAATEPSTDDADPAWTRGILVGFLGAQKYILDVKSIRHRHHFVQKLIETTAEEDGVEVVQVVPQDPGQAGKTQHEQYRELLGDYEVRKYKPSGEDSGKEEMAKPVSADVDAGEVYVLEGAWTPGLIQEMSVFPGKGFKKDQVDALSAAWFWGPALQRRNKFQGKRVRIGVQRTGATGGKKGRPKIVRPAGRHKRGGVS
jgi:predicted phage terminase large subunit-like protein